MRKKKIVYEYTDKEIRWFQVGILLAMVLSLIAGMCIGDRYSQQTIPISSGNVYQCSGWNIPASDDVDRFCVSKGYTWGTLETLTCDTQAKCFRELPDNGLKVDCISMD